MGLSTLTANLQTRIQWTAQNNITGRQPYGQSDTITKSYNIGTSAGNTTTGGADELFSFQQAITAGSSATIDLNAMTNILQQSSVAIVRIKGIQIRLLSASDDSTLSPAPNANSTVTVHNNVTLPNSLDVHTGGTGLTIALTQSGGAITGGSIGAAGSGYPKSTTFMVVPVQSGGSGGTYAVTTNASGVPTAVAFTSAGSGYSNATVPTVVLGHYTILTGGAHLYFDVGGSGFSTVSSTLKNMKIDNNDGTNAVTAEITVVGATS